MKEVVNDRAAIAPREALSGLDPDEWPFTSRHVQVDGNDLHYIDEGTGPILLFVHVGFWSFIWRDVIVRLKNDFRCVALDFPGTGFSRAGRGHQHTLPANARVLDSFVRALGLGDMTLVLHDLGGPVGFEFARQNPELVDAFVITQTFGWPVDEYPWVARMCRFMSGKRMTGLNRRINLVAQMSKGRFGVGRHLSRVARKNFLVPFQDKETRQTWSRLIGDPLERTEFLQIIDQSLRTTLSDRPALTIFGERNDPYRWQQRYADTFRTTTDVVIDKGMHFPFTEDPDTFASSVRNWWMAAVAR